MRAGVAWLVATLGAAVTFGAAAGLVRGEESVFLFVAAPEALGRPAVGLVEDGVWRVGCVEDDSFSSQLKRSCFPATLRRSMVMRACCGNLARSLISVFDSIATIIFNPAEVKKLSSTMQ